MARNILCENDNKKCEQVAIKFHEYFKSIKGAAKRDFYCDICGTLIPKDSECYCGVLLDNIKHQNLTYQTPEVWASEYINY